MSRLLWVVLLAGLLGLALRPRPRFPRPVSESFLTDPGKVDELARIGSALALASVRGELPPGTDLTPLVGRFLEELPKDPWGREYLYDSLFGMLASYGRDGGVGGEGEDADLVLRLRDPIQLARVRYRPGSTGKPAALLLELTGPVHEAHPHAVPWQLKLLRGAEASGLGGSVGSERWASAGEIGGGGEEHRPEEGRLVMLWVGADPDPLVMDPAPSLDFWPEMESAKASLVETYTRYAEPPSPAEPVVYGWEALETYRRPIRSGAVPVERY